MPQRCVVDGLHRFSRLRKPPRISVELPPADAQPVISVEFSKARKVGEDFVMILGILLGPRIHPPRQPLPILHLLLVGIGDLSVLSDHLRDHRPGLANRSDDHGGGRRRCRDPEFTSTRA